MDKLPALPNGQSSATFNNNYLCSITGTNENREIVNIKASIPESFGMTLSSSWEKLISANSLIQNRTGLTRSLALIANARLMNQSLTQLIWVETSELEFNIPFLFDAYNDAYKDVMEPVKELMKLILPSATSSSAVLRTPGPGIGAVINGIRSGLTPGESSATDSIAGFFNSLARGNTTNANTTNNDITQAINPSDGAYGSGYNLTLNIGKYKFKNIIVKTVAPQFDSMFTKQGDVTNAQVDVTFSSSTMLIKSDIDEIFGQTTSASPTNMDSNRIPDSLPSAGGIGL